MRKKNAILLGSGTNLITRERLINDIDRDECIIIGGNLTFIEHDLDVFCSSYKFHCDLCKTYNPGASILKFNTIHENEYLGAENVVKSDYLEEIGIIPELINIENKISTEFNQIIGMTHYAASLGVSKIYYSGFHQLDYNYFWQLDSHKMNLVEKVVKSLLESYSELEYGLTSEDQRVLDNINEHCLNINDFSQYEFYNNSIVKAIFADLKMLNIEFDTFDSSGIVHEVLYA